LNGMIQLRRNPSTQIESRNSPKFKKIKRWNKFDWNGRRRELSLKSKERSDKRLKNKDVRNEHKKQLNVEQSKKRREKLQKLKGAKLIQILRMKMKHQMEKMTIIKVEKKRRLLIKNKKETKAHLIRWNTVKRDKTMMNNPIKPITSLKVVLKHWYIKRKNPRPMRSNRLRLMKSMKRLTKMMKLRMREKSTTMRRTWRKKMMLGSERRATMKTPIFSDRPPNKTKKTKKNKEPPKKLKKDLLLLKPPRSIEKRKLLRKKQLNKES